MENISKQVRKKGYLIFRKNKVKKKLETDKRIHFEVIGETDVYSVIFDKEKNSWSCSCKWSSLKKGICSHIYAVKLKEKLK